MDQYSSYIHGHRRLSYQAEAARLELFSALNERVRQVASFIGHRYNVQRVYLFGSLADVGRFSLSSDVDLAVLGLAPAAYLDVWGDIENRLEHPFDLVCYETAATSLRECILREGVMIYDREDPSL